MSDIKKEYLAIKEKLEKKYDAKIDIVLGLDENPMSKYYKTKGRKKEKEK